MAVYFFDSSAIVKRYVHERGSLWKANTTHPRSRNDLYMSRITGVEVVSAIARRQRRGDISVSDAMAGLTLFRNDLGSQYQLVELTPALITGAMQLAETYALRGYDAVQLTAALEVRQYCVKVGIPSLTLVSADVALNTAAVYEGLIVDDPNGYR